MASANLYRHIVKADQSPSGGGYKNVVLFAPVSTFLSIKVPTATPTALGDTVKITTAHTFNTDEGWISLLSKLHSVTGTAETTGDEGAQSIIWKYKFTILGDNAINLETLKTMLNDNCIFLLKDSDCLAGTAYVQIGDECLSPTLKISFDGKTTKEGLKEYTVEMEVKDKKFFYSSTVTMKA